MDPTYTEVLSLCLKYVIDMISHHLLFTHFIWWLLAVELGRRYFPNCSQVLDKFLEDDLPDGLDQFYLQRGTADEQKVKRMRFCELKEDVLKAFSKDKADSSMFSGLSSSSSCSPPQKSTKR